MKKSYIIVLVVLFVIGLCGSFYVGRYNKLVTADEEVIAKWAQVENQYQRRADLIPNLVNTVKGYATHESETLESVVAARAKATQVTIDPTNMSAEALAQYQAAQGELSQALGRLMVVSESYPDLKANENFRDLQAQLEGTENRIATERMRYSEAVKAFNTRVRKFPTSIIASMGGFSVKPQFQAEASAQQVPTVQF